MFYSVLNASRLTDNSSGPLRKFPFPPALLKYKRQLVAQIYIMQFNEFLCHYS